MQALHKEGNIIYRADRFSALAVRKSPMLKEVPERNILTLPPSALEEISSFVAGAFQKNRNLPETDPDVEEREAIQGFFETGTFRIDYKGQDRVAALPSTLFLFDGMSNPEGGEVAAEIACAVSVFVFREEKISVLSSREKVIRAMNRSYDLAKKLMASYEDLNLAETLTRTESQILSQVVEKFPRNSRDEKAEHIGTTAIIMHVMNEGGKKKMIIGHNGNSRGYLITREGLQMVTRDHTLSSLADFLNDDQEKVEQAKQAIDQATSIEDLEKKLAAIDRDLEMYAAVFWSEKNLLEQYWNGSLIEFQRPQITEIELPEGVEGGLVTSDGLHENLTQKQMDDTVFGDEEGGEESNEKIRQKIKNHELVSRAYDTSLMPNELNVRAHRDDISAGYILF